MMRNILLFIITLFLMASCSNSQRVSPKPRAYPKINYPDRGYQLRNDLSCPLNLEIPKYAEIETKNDPSGSGNDIGCWFDIHILPFDARIHCSYYPIDNATSFEKYKSDAFKLVDKHNIKANYIERFPILQEDNNSGFLFKIDGPVASNYQFYLSDSTANFLRGSLYFNTQINIDSLQEVIDFLYADIEHLIGSVEWHNKK